MEFLIASAVGVLTAVGVYLCYDGRAFRSSSASHSCPTP